MGACDQREACNIEAASVWTHWTCHLCSRVCWVQLYSEWVQG